MSIIRKGKKIAFTFPACQALSWHCKIVKCDCWHSVHNVHVGKECFMKMHHKKNVVEKNKCKVNTMTLYTVPPQQQNCFCWRKSVKLCTFYILLKPLTGDERNAICDMTFSFYLLFSLLDRATNHSMINYNEIFPGFT